MLYHDIIYYSPRRRARSLPGRKAIPADLRAKSGGRADEDSSHVFFDDRWPCRCEDSR